MACATNTTRRRSIRDNEIIGWYPGQQSTRLSGRTEPVSIPGRPWDTEPRPGLSRSQQFRPPLWFCVGHVWDRKLVMRGGFGIFYDIEDGALNLQFGGQPPFGYVANNYPCFTRRQWAASAALSPYGSYSCGSISRPATSVLPTLIHTPFAATKGSFYSGAFRLRMSSHPTSARPTLRISISDFSIN